MKACKTSLLVLSFLLCAAPQLLWAAHTPKITTLISQLPKGAEILAVSPDYTKIFSIVTNRDTLEERLRESDKYPLDPQYHDLVRNGNIAEGLSTRVFLNEKEIGNYTGQLKTGTVVFSADSMHVAYVIGLVRKNPWKYTEAVVIDGKMGKEYETTERLFISADGKKIAFEAFSPSNASTSAPLFASHLVVSNGTEIQTNCQYPVLVMAPNGDIAYKQCDPKNQAEAVVFNGKKGKTYDRVSAFLEKGNLSEDGRKMDILPAGVAYQAFDLKKMEVFAVIGEKEGEHFPVGHLEQFVASVDGKTTAYVLAPEREVDMGTNNPLSDGMSVIANGKKVGSYLRVDDLRVTDGKVSFIAFNTVKPMMYIDGKITTLGTVDAYDLEVLSDDTPLYRVYEDGGYNMYLGQKMISKGYFRLCLLNAQRTDFACISVPNDTASKQFVITKTRRSKNYSQVGSAIFSPDGKQMALTVKERNKWSIIIGTKKMGTYDTVSLPFFSKDGKSITYIATSGQKYTRVEQPL